MEHIYFHCHVARCIWSVVEVAFRYLGRGLPKLCVAFTVVVSMGNNIANDIRGHGLSYGQI